jgi:predicted transcriptional regulator
MHYLRERGVGKRKRKKGGEGRSYEINNYLVNFNEPSSSITDN